MDSVRPKRVPWRSWSDFTGWAQDFSLRQKVLGGFLGVVLLVGLATILIGTRLARETIIDRARIRLFSDLATAGFILKNSQENLELKVRLMAGSEKIKELLGKGEIQEVRNGLAKLAVENDLDFLAVTDDKGRVLARAFAPEIKNPDVSSDSLVAAALKGQDSSGVRLVSVEGLADENPTLIPRLGERPDKKGMILEAAHPLLVGTRVAATLYGWVLLNNNNLIVDRISHRLFRGEVFEKRDVGYVAIFQGDQAISTTLRGAEGLPTLGFKAGGQIRDKVLDKGQTEITWESQLGATYLSATDPIRNAEGQIVGALQVATLEKPITSVITQLVGTFLVVAFFGVLLMAAISYYLVKWINRPLDQMLHAARRAADGDLSHEVPVMARDEIGARATLLRSQGRKVLDFSVGEPDQDTPARVRRAAAAAMNRGETRYVPSLGIPELRKAVADRYAADDGVRFEPAEVAITLGGKQAYSLACEALFNPGDEMVIPTPFWPTFSEAPRLVGGVPVFAPLDAAKGFAFDPDLILRKVGKRTRALILNSPSNPTGAVVSERALVDIALSMKKRAKDAFLIYDDTYARLLYVDGRPRMLPRVREILGDRFLISGTASKTYCMTGWRIGWLLAHKSVIQAVSALISHQTQCAASFAQFGAVEALAGPQDFVTKQTAEYRVRRDLVVRELNEIPGIKCRVPLGAFYAFPDIRKILSPSIPDALTFASRLLDEKGVAVVAGEGFGCPGFVRLSFARSRSELREGMAAIKAFVAAQPKVKR